MQVDTASGLARIPVVRLSAGAATFRTSIRNGYLSNDRALYLTPVPELDLRIAFLTPALSPHRLALIESMARGVKDLRVFLSEARDSLHKFPVDWGTLNVTVQKSLNWKHRFRNIYGYRDISHIHLPYDTLSQLTRYKPDVIIAAELGTRSFLAVLYRLRHRKVKLIVWATLSDRTEATRGRFRALLRKWIVARVDAIFVNGKGGTDYMRHLGYTGPLYVVPYAIDDSPFRARTYDPTPGCFRLLYTGQLIPRKGLPAFCTVLSRWCADHPATTVSFWLVGEGPEGRLIENIQTPPNLSIKISGRVDQAALVLFYEQSDIYAFPTLADEWGVVVNEALIAGRPVLGSIYSQAVGELVTDGFNGWLWDPSDAENSYKTLDRALTFTPEQLVTFSHNAKKSVASISPEFIAERILDAVGAIRSRPR
jgi:glycosyltransferase involved in cell wall biosynthesis